jgi:hypothetical protein
MKNEEFADARATTHSSFFILILNSEFTMPRSEFTPWVGAGAQ